MKSKALVTLFSVLSIVFAVAATASAQGWKPTQIDAGVDLAADFAVKEQADRAKTTITLNKVVKASDKQPKLGARDFMLCLDTTVTNTQTYVQAIVTMDQYSNLKLMGWSKSTCGKDADGGSAVVHPGFTPNTKYKHVDINDAGADLAAQNAVILQSKKTKSNVTYNEILKAEDMERSLGTRDFRLCLSIATNGKQGQAQALVSVDQYSNYKLTGWTEMKCSEAAADGFNPVEKEFTAGVDMAADWAVGKHSKDTGIAHKLVEILRREEKGMFAMTYRICMKVGEGNETQVIQAVVTRDQYSNHKLVSWEHSNCTK